jgi:hypothetical protein
MSFFEEHLAKRLEDPEFKREWEESEEEYSIIKEIILERIRRLENDSDSTVKWRDIKREE